MGATVVRLRQGHGETLQWRKAVVERVACLLLLSLPFQRVAQAWESVNFGGGDARGSGGVKRHVSTSTGAARWSRCWSRAMSTLGLVHSCTPQAGGCVTRTCNTCGLPHLARMALTHHTGAFPNLPQLQVEKKFHDQKRSAEIAQIVKIAFMYI